MSAFAYLLQRETWENRAIVFAPVIVGGVLLTGLLLSLFQGVTSAGFEQVVIKMEELGEMRTAGAFAVTSVLLFAIAVVFAFVMMIMLFFYMLDALYSERKDRSILFWRSLPVSDNMTVLSKLATAIVVAPLITLAALAITDIVTLIMGTVFTWFRGGSAWELIWGPAPLFKSWVIVGYGLLAMVIWFLPFFGWLLLVSAWARQTPFLWAILPPLAILIIEKIVNGTHTFFTMIGEYKVEFFRAAFDVEMFEGFDKEHTTEAEELQVIGTIQDNLLGVIDIGGLLSAPELWAGLAVAAVFTSGAIYLRRWREEA
ncbi:MAG: hypothetical protein V3S70_01675 [Gammaproteobacteria bacterium]